MKENVIIGRLIPARIHIPGMEELLKPEPVPEISAMSPGGWLSATGASTGAFDQPPAKDVTDEPNVFTEASNGDEPAPAPEPDIVEQEDAPEDKIDLKDAESDDLGLAEASELSANGLGHDGENGASPALGEEDAAGSGESDTATDGEGDE